MDIEFAEPEDVAEVTRDNCFNSSDISFQSLFATTSLQSAAPAFDSSRRLASALLPAVLMGWLLM